VARPANLELRDKILKAAAEIIEGCGPDCVTMREVAEKVGYSPTTLYLYFKDKNDILKEAILCGFDSLADSCNAAMVGPRPLDKFRQRCRGYVMWGLLNPGHYQLMFEGTSTISLVGEDHARAVRGITDGGRVAQEAIDAGDLPPIDDPKTFADASWAGIHGATSLAISRRLMAGHDEITPPAVTEVATRAADAIINALIASLGPPPRKRRSTAASGTAAPDRRAERSTRRSTRSKKSP
jgi:AcrR family transcriptional regulator